MSTDTPTPALLCQGDMHLSHLIWFARKEIRDDALVAFTELIDTAISMKLPLVLVGDLNDTVNPPTDIVEFIRSQIDRCQAADIRVFFIDGNHDKRPIMPWLTAIHDWPVHIDNKLIEVNGLKIAGFDYRLAPDIEKALAELGSWPELPQVLFLHQAVKQGLGFVGAYNCDLDMIPAGIPLTIMGDIHGPAEYPTRGGIALYTSSTHPRDIQEVGFKSMVIVNSDLTYSRLGYMSQRNFRKVVLVEDHTENLQELLEWAHKAVVNFPILPPVLWVEYSLACTSFVEELAARLTDAGPGVILVRQAMKFRAHSEIEKDVDTSDVPTVAQLVPRVVDPAVHPFAHQMTLALTDPKCDPQEVIASFRARFLAQPA